MVETTNEYDDTIAIGIDLGTSFARVAFWNSAKNALEIIRNDYGKTMTPSVVAFRQEVLVGDMAIRNAKNTITEVKRLIGRDINEPEVQQLIRTLPFKVVEGERHEARICIQVEGKEEQQYTAEEI